jgi:hypothetical protein
LPTIYRSQEQAEQALQSEHFDGYLVYTTAMWTGIAELYARNAHPVSVADELYSGSGGFLRVHSMVKKEWLPVVGMASSDFQDVIDAVRLIDVLRRMRETRILVTADRETWA